MRSWIMFLGAVLSLGACLNADPVRDPLDPIPARMNAMPVFGRTAQISTGREFNPAISVIVDGLYTHIIGELEDPPGFELGTCPHHHDHDMKEGFQLREVELTLTGSVDPYFDAMIMIGFDPDHVQVEEAFITSRSLPAGLQLKAGKFFSDVGYINKQHMHDWLFVDQPWMREFMFGDHGLNEVGVQLSWLPPSDVYLRLGAEVLQGESEGVAGYIGPGKHQIVTVLPGEDGGPERVRWRADNGLSEKKGPRLFTGFAKVAPDIGMNHALQLGMFGGYSRAFQAEEAHSSGRLEIWDGHAWFAGSDIVYKYDGQGVHGHRNLTLQAEYMYRILDLEYRNLEFESFSSLVPTESNDQRWKQDGLYLQCVYGFAPRWNTGLRADVLGMRNDGFEDRGDPKKFGSSYRYTGQVSFAPTEFSRVRLQTSYTDLAGSEHDDVWILALQYNISLGAHGAHAF